MTPSAIVQRLAAAGCVYPEDEAEVLGASATTAEELEAMVARRAAGEPLERVVGWAEFRGLRFAVDDGVFVPRARTEFLVEEAASLVRCAAGAGRDVLVVDLCCGTGAVGGALAAELPEVVLHAVDIDPRAVACARRNLSRWSGTVRQGDLFAALPRKLRGRVDVVVASPPYVPTGQMHLLTPEAREFELVTALDGGPEGVDLVDRIADGARRWLAPGVSLAVEVAETQLDRAEGILARLGYATRAVTSEAYGSAVVTGRLPG